MGCVHIDLVGGYSTWVKSHSCFPAKARKHSASKDWVGKMVAFVLDRNLDQRGVKQGIEEMLRVWLDSGVLRTVERQAADRHVYEFVEVGRWAEA